MAFFTAEAFAPATVANLGVGFDILGLALREPGDTVVVRHRNVPGAVIASIEGDSGKLPRDPDRNTACIAANSVLRTLGAQQGVEIHLHKDLPLASGLGSSAASAVAAAVAVNALFGEPLARAELLPACLEAEAAVSGYHADNVAPSLFGGITLVTGTQADQIRRLPIPDNMYLALVTPDVAVPTAEARAVLPRMVSLRDMVAQTGAVARLVDGLYRGDLLALAEAMESDCVVEPARVHLMPLLHKVRAAAKRAGALALVISGAGPTLCAMCDSGMLCEQAASAMKAIYDEARMTSTARRTRVSGEGARVLSHA